MPRKPWRKVRPENPTVPENVRRYLETGESEPGDCEVFLLQGDPERVLALWREVGAEILSAWLKAHPGTRPAVWWEVSAPSEPVPGWPTYLCAQRRRIGGTGTPNFEVLAYAPHFDRGIPTGWVSTSEVNHYGHGFTGKAIGRDDPPRFEAEAAFLDRHGILTAPERRWLTAHPEAMTPETIVFDEDEDQGEDLT